MENKKRKREDKPFSLDISYENQVIKLFRSGNHVWIVEQCLSPDPKTHISMMIPTRAIESDIKRFGVHLDHVQKMIKTQAEEKKLHVRTAWYATNIFGPDEAWFFDPDVLVEAWILGSQEWVDKVFEESYSQENQSSVSHEMVKENEKKVFDISIARKKTAKRDLKTELTHYHAYDELNKAQDELLQTMKEFVEIHKKKKEE